MIYYFTGTGNSRYIARKLHQQLNEDYLSMNTLIRNNDHSLQNIQGTLVLSCLLMPGEYLALSKNGFV